MLKTDWSSSPSDLKRTSKIKKKTYRDPKNVSGKDVAHLLPFLYIHAQRSKKGKRPI